MRTLLFVTALALAAACQQTDANKGKDKTAEVKTAETGDLEIPDLTVDDVAKQIDAKAITPVDCNTERTRKRMGVIPGAVLVSDDEGYAASELPADKNTKLVFYCSSPS